MATRLAELKTPLLAFLEENPTGTHEEFVDSAVRAGIGSEQVIRDFVQVFLDGLEFSCVIDEAKWQLLMSKVSVWLTSGESGLIKLRSMFEEQFQKAYRSPPMEEVVNRAELEDYDAIIVDARKREDVLLPGVQWIKENMPNSPAKVAVLKTLARGKNEDIDALISAMTRKREALLEEMGED